MSADSWRSPAKINRFLHITGVRDTGYHELESIFQFVDLSDELRFSVNQSADICIDVIDERSLIDGAKHSVSLAKQSADNICHKAALALKSQLLKSELSDSFGVHITLIKRIPIGGGLGGGSSNAATTLLALNHLWHLGLSQQELLDIGLTLGADVPFFIQGQTAWVEGIGEIITPICSDKLPDEPIWLIVPSVSVATAAIYAHANLKRDYSQQSDWQSATNLNDLIDQSGNVMTPVVFELHPQLRQLEPMLAAYGDIRMSGSGSTFFVISPVIGIDNEAEIAELSDQLASIGCQLIMTRTLNQSPLKSVVSKL